MRRNPGHLPPGRLDAVINDGRLAAPPGGAGTHLRRPDRYRHAAPRHGPRPEADRAQVSRALWTDPKPRRTSEGQRFGSRTTFAASTVWAVAQKFAGELTWNRRRGFEGGRQARIRESNCSRRLGSRRTWNTISQTHRPKEKPGPGGSGSFPGIKTGTEPSRRVR